MSMHVLAWAGLALFLYFLLTRLSALAGLVGTYRGLGEGGAVRIRPSRIVVEALVVVAVLGLWATRALDRGRLDWEVGGSGSPLHLELSGVWFAAAAIAVTAALIVLLGFAGLMAFIRADDLRERFPRPAKGRPYVLRLALLNAGIVFPAPRRNPFVWIWTELRAAAFGVLSALAVEAVHEEHPIAGGQLGATLDEASTEFELGERLARGGLALTWNALPLFLARVSKTPSPSSSQLNVPHVEIPTGARAVGALVGCSRARETPNERRTSRRCFRDSTSVGPPEPSSRPPTIRWHGHIWMMAWMACCIRCAARFSTG